MLGKELLECLSLSFFNSLKNVLCFLLCAMQYVLGNAHVVVNKIGMFPSLMGLEEDR